MNIQIEPINSRAKWEGFVSSINPPSFLHSWAWGEFNKSMGNKVFRLGIFENKKLVGVALAIKIIARRGSFLFCPHGPLIRAQNYSLKLKALVDFLKRLATKEDCGFLRISPLWENTQENKRLFQDLGFRPAPLYMHAEVAWILDLLPKEEELLLGMRKTTRYLIKKAEKEGVRIEKSTNPKDIEIFNKIYKETARRQRFTPFSKEYLVKEFSSFAKENKATLFFGKYQNEVLAAALIIFSYSSAFYHQGASTLKFPKIPASYLLQWAAIKEAKKRGCRFYNFWGIAPSSDDRLPLKRSHPWYGLALFKQGFGGFVQRYLHAQDLPLNHWYWLNFLVEKLRKIKRRL